eukprot:CAMPEP_0116897780 /NCGR_PEP_ID=MMETSP0467-20121206/6667_1 /TAXON_ID=283647 /ORGANISM="Mesodinium pulex, Strain SPMC105" /LENGTH=118 /DNA_ID=CAMNT_0004569579 /DNA_START=92 /DNA_END=448 /DNA_ORIENTATION=-
MTLFNADPSLLNLDTQKNAFAVEFANGQVQAQYSISANSASGSSNMLPYSANTNDFEVTFLLVNGRWDVTVLYNNATFEYGINFTPLSVNNSSYIEFVKTTTSSSLVNIQALSIEVGF